MKRTIISLAIGLLFSISAAAQGLVGVGSGGANHGDFTPQPWQLTAGYQYNAINLTGQAFQTSGANITVARFFGNWVGVEGQFGTGFGNTGSTSAPPNLNVKSLSLVGGARLAYRGHSRIQPWIHGDVGVQHFSFNQTAGVLGSNTSLAFQEGAGLDLSVTPNLASRIEGDFLETQFFSLSQRHFQITGGFVFNF